MMNNSHVCDNSGKNGPIKPVRNSKSAASENTFAARHSHKQPKDMNTQKEIAQSSSP